MNCEVINLSAGDYLRFEHKGLTMCVPLRPEMTVDECLRDQARAYARKARYYQRKAEEYTEAAEAMAS